MTKSTTNNRLLKSVKLRSIYLSKQSKAEFLRKWSILKANLE